MQTFRWFAKLPPVQNYIAANILTVFRCYNYDLGIILFCIFYWISENQQEAINIMQNWLT